MVLWYVCKENKSAMTDDLSQYSIKLGSISGFVGEQTIALWQVVPFVVL